MDNSSNYSELFVEVLKPIKPDKEYLETPLLKEFLCPVCLNYAAPPILMCKNSHVICFTCWDRCEICPTCRKERFFTRAMILEKLHPKVMFPCKHDKCTLRLPGATIKEHERNCTFLPTSCPLRTLQTCTWNGPIAHMSTHLLEHHKPYINFHPRVRLIFKGFRSTPSKSTTLIFYCYGQFFQVTWEFNRQESHIVVFTMTQLGSQDRSKSFKFTVAVLKQFCVASKKDGYILQGRDTQNASECKICYGLLDYLCVKPNGDLYYEIVIRRHNGSPGETKQFISLKEYERLVYSWILQ